MVNKKRCSLCYYVLLLLAILGYLGLCVWLERSLFAFRLGRENLEVDGFQQAIVYVVSGGDEVPLWLLIRYLVVSPLLFLSELPNHAVWEGLYLLGYSLPVVMFFKNKGLAACWMLGLIFIPVFISFRLAISIYTVVFLLLTLRERQFRPILTIWYMFPLFLSSSTMYIYLLYFPLFCREKIKQASWPMALTVSLAYLIISLQFLEKIYLLYERSLGGEVLSTAQEFDTGAQSGGLSGFIGNLLMGNPITTALVYGQYDRFLIIIPSIMLLSMLMLKLWVKREQRLLLFFLLLASSMVSEGAASYAIGICAFVVYCNQVDFFKPSRLAYEERMA